MGIYVYALNTKIHTISNVTVGIAEFRYKEHISFGNEHLNTKMYNLRCKRRVEYFENNELPSFFVLGKFEEGSPVYSHLTKDNRRIGACFDDGIKFNAVGQLTKVGRSWTIKWN